MPRILPFSLLVLVLNACQSSQQESGFYSVPAAISQLDFVNEITESDTFNILTNEFIYNGAGVAIGDLNGDGWDDLFFTGNQVDNELFLNRGGLQFEKVGTTAGIHKPDPNYWSSGVNLIDLNLDGRLDIYVCNTLQEDGQYRNNWLYINQGNTAEGIPQFKEMAAAYGIADTSHSSHAQFFDYDRDGDLDLFIGTNQIVEEIPSDFQENRKMDGSSPTRDLLFQNNWNENLGHPVFTDVSLAAGLVQEGYSHSTLINDFNEDGWPDIFVANDFQSDDLLFINQKDGTFKDEARNILKHFSLSSMGSDLADVNNDGRLDFFVTEMQPFYNKRKKLFQGPSNYQRQKLTERYGYHYQYPRNVLHLNQGIQPESETPIFSDVGLYAHVQETDWSWASLFADYDNDGYQDLFIANGFPKDVTDHDFSDFRSMASRLVDIKELLSAIPAVKVHNFLFQNTGALRFEDVTKEWGLQIATFSNGAAYGDLDKDGDLDLVVCNIDDPVALYENRIINPDNHYLRIQLQGPESNPQAYGTKVSVFAGGQAHTAFLLSGRGYLSQSEATLHFGLGQQEQVDSILIVWPEGSQQKWPAAATNQLLEIHFAPGPEASAPRQVDPLFQAAETEHQLTYEHAEIDYVDFNVQRTLPHKFSQYGPAIAIADVNNDGLDDVLLGASYSRDQTWFIQRSDGSFFRKEARYKTDDAEGQDEDAGLLLFDADGDGHKDLYIAKGGGQFRPQTPFYQDMLLLNDGQGNFTFVKTALPEFLTNSSAVKGADFDRDGDIDLFVGSRVRPLFYPQGESSYILRNDSAPGQPRFSEVTSTVIPELGAESLVSDAIWTDFNNDFWPDLIVMSEWSPIRVFENQQGLLREITAQSGIADYTGWWNSIAAADLDNDGDTDYIAGNFGENIFFQCSTEEPLRIYAKDLDNNGSLDPFISCYWPDSLGRRHEYLYHPLQDVIKQFVGIRKNINTFAEYGEATVDDIFAGGELDDALQRSANWMKTSWIENKGNGQFAMHPLPRAAQFAPAYGLLPIDVNQDGLLDIVMVGNDHGMEVQQGRADAAIGLVLQNEGQGNFRPLSLEESHFFVPGDAKSLAVLGTGRKKPLLIASQNQGPLKVFAWRAQQQRMIPVTPEAVRAVLAWPDGTQRIQEFYWGSTFQSQSGRYLFLPPGVEIQYFNQQGDPIENKE